MPDGNVMSRKLTAIPTPSDQARGICGGHHRRTCRGLEAAAADVTSGAERPCERVYTPPQSWA